jgi:hypothetical protein
MGGLRWVCVVACVVAVVGLGCERQSSKQARSGLVAAPEKLEFGPAALGVTKTMTLRLTNGGRAPFTVQGVVPTLPNVKVPPFEPFELKAGEDREVEVRFAPDVEGPVEGLLEVLTDASNANEEGVARFGVTGRGVKSLLRLGTDRLDFGTVELGTARVLELSMHNATEVPLQVRLAVDGMDGDQFSSSEMAGVLTLAPGEVRMVPVAFSPYRVGAAAALAHVTCEGCEPIQVELAGTGIAAKLEVSPPLLNFGRVTVGATAEDAITLRNLGNERMVYGGVKLLNDTSGSFSVVSAPRLAGNVLEPGEMTQVRVAFKPTASGGVRPALVEIDLRPQGATSPPPKVELRGEGGTSCVSVVPAHLDFGVVAEGMSATRSVKVINRCATDVLVNDQTLSTKSGGYFLLAQAPSSLPVAAGTTAELALTFMPRSASGAGEALLSLKVLQGRSNSTEVVKLTGTGRVFEPCQYALAPAMLDFGRVPVGSEVALGVKLRNTGSSQCYLAGMKVAGGSDEAFQAEVVGNTVLEPGKHALLLVRFKPQAVGTLTGMAEGWVNHPNQGHPLIPLKGEGVQGCFLVQPTSLDFGNARLTCGPRQREAILYNRCGGPVTLQGLTYEGESNEFTVSHELFFPATLAPNSQHKVRVTYQPVDGGDDTGALRFTLGSGAPYTVGLVGRGENKDDQTDEFLQQSASKVDVLFVVDNSGSMMDEQQSLGQNFAAFLSHATAAGVNYHIAVTTTGLDPSPGGWAQCTGGAEGGENGRFYPVNGQTPRIITPNTPGAASVFAHNTQVGVCHWNEQGLDAMHRALSDPLVNNVDDPRSTAPADGNAGFLRDDARLAIIVVTDEEDFSARPVSFYETFLLGLKGQDRSKVTVSAIAGPQDLRSCPKASSTGSRYIQLAQATGGVVESICTANWAASLEKISESAFGRNRVFKLSELPEDTARIVVRVDGLEVKAGWKYEPGTNSIVFEQDAAPGAGSSIEVTYPVGC